MPNITKFSANLGFLWRELPLPEAIYAAKKAGFDAVECHWPYAVAVEEVKRALAETGLRMLGLNTPRGNVEKGENGLAALPGREAEAQAAVDEALAYGRAIGASIVHVMAGVTAAAEARKTFIRNLKQAAAKAASAGMSIVIEPLNKFDAPGYFLSTTVEAQAIIEEVAAPNLKLMFDCYHVQIMEGDLSRKLKSLLPLIGHVQIAAVPDRQEPDHGEVDYRYILSLLQHLGYDQPIGAEYRPAASTEAGLGWMQRLRS